MHRLYPLYFTKKVHSNKKTYFNTKGVWVAGEGASVSTTHKFSSDAEAVNEGIKIRDDLVKAIKIIEMSLPLESIESCNKLYEELYKVNPKMIDKFWVLKYFHMLFPETFSPIYSTDMQKEVLDILGIDASDNPYSRMWQINEFVKKCGISNMVFEKVYRKYCENMNDDDYKRENFNKARLSGGENIIFYGVPGSGKSWVIDNKYCRM